jgi:hypothetical protein
MGVILLRATGYYLSVTLSSNLIITIDESDLSQEMAGRSSVLLVADDGCGRGDRLTEEEGGG